MPRRTDNVTKPAPTSPMTPAHPRWNEFCRMLFALVKAKGCDSRTQSLTVEALSAMGEGATARESIRGFERAGGYCGCEVLMNSLDFDRREYWRRKIVQLPGYAVRRTRRA